MRTLSPNTAPPRRPPLGALLGALALLALSPRPAPAQGLTGQTLQIDGLVGLVPADVLPMHILDSRATADLSAFPAVLPQGQSAYTGPQPALDYFGLPVMVAVAAAFGPLPRQRDDVSATATQVRVQLEYSYDDYLFSWCDGGPDTRFCGYRVSPAGVAPKAITGASVNPATTAREGGKKPFDTGRVLVTNGSLYINLRGIDTVPGGSDSLILLDVTTAP